MKRGAAVGIVYLIALVALILLVLVLIPAIVKFAEAVQSNIAGWIDDLNAWTTATFGGEAVSTAWARRPLRSARRRWSTGSKASSDGSR